MPRGKYVRKQKLETLHEEPKKDDEAGQSQRQFALASDIKTQIIKALLGKENPTCQ